MLSLQQGRGLISNILIQPTQIQQNATMFNACASLARVKERRGDLVRQPRCINMCVH